MVLSKRWLNLFQYEDALYTLSERLGIEIFVVGVGNRVYLPRQFGTSIAVATDDEAMAEWVVTCIDRPNDLPWWTHTHPGFPASFSLTDEEGARRLWDAIRRPIRAVVLGTDNTRYEDIIDKRWVARHPALDLYDWQHPDGDFLEQRLRSLMDKYGYQTFVASIASILGREVILEKD